MQRGSSASVIVQNDAATNRHRGGGIGNRRRDTSGRRTAACCGKDGVTRRLARLEGMAVASEALGQPMVAAVVLAGHHLGRAFPHGRLSGGRAFPRRAFADECRPSAHTLSGWHPLH